VRWQAGWCALTARERMLAGELYDATDSELAADRQRARELLQRYAGERDPALLDTLFRQRGKGSAVEAPFHCDYGWNIALGERVYANAFCVFLDCAPIEIGDRALLGPGVHLYTATHPLEAAERRQGLEYARPIAIGVDAWIGGGSIVLPGVSVGEAAVVGAGSVVTRDVPAGVTVVGNPARESR
jgi:maltose O-acetyltransferase